MRSWNGPPTWTDSEQSPQRSWTARRSQSKRERWKVSAAKPDATRSACSMRGRVDAASGLSPASGADMYVARVVSSDQPASVTPELSPSADVNGGVSKDVLRA